MNSLIEKTSLLTSEEYKNTLDNLSNDSYRLVFALLCFLVLFAIARVLYDKHKEPLSGLFMFTTGLVSGLSFLFFISLLFYSFIFSVSHRPGKTMINKDIPITEIKEHIKIEDNRLTIDALPENYQYKDNKLDKTKPHDFKIDDFYKELNVKLIDSNNNTYEITHEQLEELKQ